MDGRGLRSVLQPTIYFGVAFLLHALLFLIPLEGPGRPDPQTTRGIRVKVVSQRSIPPRPAVSPATKPLPAVSPKQAVKTDTSVPRNIAEENYSLGGSEAAGGGIGDAADPAGGTGNATGAEGDAPPMSEYSRYLARLRSEGVQGWARDTAQSSRREWKGTGVKRRGAGDGFGSGEGSQEGSGTGYLDPRVRMVVTSYPPTGIERRHTYVPYPDIQFKKHQYTSGWWNVYIQIRTDGSGKIVRYDVLRPKTDGKLERLFVQQVKKEVERWEFDPVAAEINIDVRFYVE